MEYITIKKHTWVSFKSSYETQVSLYLLLKKSKTYCLQGWKLPQSGSNLIPTSIQTSKTFPQNVKRKNLITTVHFISMILWQNAILRISRHCRLSLNQSLSTEKSNYCIYIWGNIMIYCLNNVHMHNHMETIYTKI